MPLWSDGSAGDDVIELADVLATLRRRKWMVVGFLLGAVAIAEVLVRVEEPRYTATALIRLEDTQRALAGGLDDVAENLTGRPSNPLLTQLQILHSAQVLGETVDREGLRLVSLSQRFRPSSLEGVWVDPEAPVDTLVLQFQENRVRVAAGSRRLEAGYGEPVEADDWRFAVPRAPGLEEVRLAIVPRRRAIDALARELRARQREGTEVVEVRYTSGDPEFAMRIVNGTVDAFRDRNIRSSRQGAERRRIFLEEQMTQADAMLADVQRTLSDFRSRERVFSSQEWFVAQQSGLLALDVRREELAADRSTYRSILDGLGVGEPGPTGRLEALVASPEIAGNPVVAGLFQRLVRYEAVRDSLVSGPWGASRTNPDVRSIDEQITSTTARLEATIRSHLESVDARLEAMDDLRARTSGEIAELPEVEAEEARLVQQLRTVERTVDLLREEYHRARITEAVEAGQVDVIDYASVPLDPEGAGRALKLSLALMLGLMMGSGAAFLSESMNTRLRHKEEMEEVLRVPSIGVVPQISSNGGLPGATRVAKVRGLIGRAGRSVGRRRVGTGQLGTGRQDPDARLVTLCDVRSPQAEAFRTIRTNLLFSGAIRSLNTLVVTSPTPEEGKTTTAANLAVAYAQQGMKVLLVDCDLRRARLHRIFGLAREPGLTDLVLGASPWSDVYHALPPKGLHVLTSGTLPPNPSEFLGGARMRRALEAFASRYELVILDTPPLIAGPDGAILGSISDGVLLVVRAGRTEKGASLHAVRQLHTVGARVLGAVLNDPDGELPKYSPYYAYQYSYYGSEA